VLKKLGKDVTAIIGDTEYPQNLMGFPNREWIQPKNYTQINPNEFDLFLILDSSSPSQITQLVEIELPDTINTVVIDHHATNSGFGKLNLIESTYSSTCQILYDLFKLWKVEINSDIAVCLFMGIYADTGGFKYLNSTPEILQIASELATINPKYHKLIFDLENNKKPIEVEMTGLALSSIEKHFSDHVVLSVIPYEEIKKRNLSKSDAMEGLVASLLKAVVGWDLVASLV
jgi:phosphoesterase RecJ-like protein